MKNRVLLSFFSSLKCLQFVLKSKLILALFLLAFSSLPQLIVGQQLSDQAKISILTCAPGNDIHTVYGHSSIRVSDPKSGFEAVYNYGTFNFEEEGFLLKFLRGKLLYSLAKANLSLFINAYNEEDRSIKEQILNLKPNEVKQFYSYLENNYQPENRRYYYDFFFDNCSTRITDAFEKALPEISFGSQRVKSTTFRDMIKEYQVTWPWYDFGVDLIIGSRADKNANQYQQTFLPDYLYNYISSGKRKDGSLLVAQSRPILKIPNKNISIFGFPKPIWIFTFLLALELLIFVSRSKWKSKLIRFADMIWVLALSIACLIVAFMWFGTDHKACGNNWNLLWLSPVYLVLFDGLLFKQKTLIKVSSWLILGLSIFTLLFWSLIPQVFNIVIIPILVKSILKCIRLLTQGVSKLA